MSMRMRKKKRKMMMTTMKQILLMKYIQLNDPALRLLKHVRRLLVCLEKSHHNRSLKEYSHHLVRIDQLPSHPSSRHSQHLLKDQQHNLQHHPSPHTDHLLHHLLHLKSNHPFNLQHKQHLIPHLKQHLTNPHQYLGINSL